MGLVASSLRRIAAVVFVLVPITAWGQNPPPIVQPGAPGASGRVITAEEASNLAGVQYSDADVKFMQGMISHHAQAIEMTDLLATRSERDVMHRLAQRIELSQKDEIKMMQEWLRSHGQAVTNVNAHHAPGAKLMPGMLSREQMAELEAARGVEFDRLFLELMIMHHKGALTMVENLLAQRGAAQASEIFAFTSDIVADQSMEIDRMGAMLAELSADPRVGLGPGFRDAGEAILNLELVATLTKPEGFYDPYAPSGRPMPRRDDEAKAEDKAKDAEEAEPKQTADPGRPGILNFANTDLAFVGDVLFEGNYHGFNAYNVEDPLTPQLLASIVCPGGQGDVSVYGDLLFMSVEQTRGRLDCGLQGVAEPVSEARFRGIRIFDISDMRMPRQVAAVQSCRGSHTHTIVTDPDDEGNLYLYGSGTSSVRPGEELEGCADTGADDPNTALFSIDVIRVPIDHPEDARLINRPRIFADPETGAIAGLWRGGDHGPGTQESRETNQCHDITVYPELGLAAGACSGNGILLDVSDPVNPVRLDSATDPGFAYWHSATFNNDGTKVVFTDEWGGGARPRCRATDPKDWGADALFDIVDKKLEFKGYFKMPAAQTELENCVAHNGSLIPVPGRDIMVQAWYQGGISVFDFTDSANPVEIAYFDRGPIDPDKLILAGYWSAYFYDGYIYGTEIARGLDVLKLLPSEYLTQNEIDAASLVEPGTFNAQQQRRIDWPKAPEVARAYLDQLERTHAIEAERIEAVSRALDEADPARLAALATALEHDISDARGRDRVRLESLAETMSGVADSLR